MGGGGGLGLARMVICFGCRYAPHVRGTYAPQLTRMETYLANSFMTSSLRKTGLLKRLSYISSGEDLTTQRRGLPCGPEMMQCRAT